MSFSPSQRFGWTKAEEASPSSSDLSTPELAGSVSSNGSTTSPFTPVRNPLNRASIDNIKPVAVMAARDRPMFKQQQQQNGVSAPPSTASTRRQLMPSIPMRRGSSLTNSDNNGKENASTAPVRGSPNLGNQTNIQNLAQAIAARAQHVAAAKAALRQQQHQEQRKQKDEDEENETKDAIYSSNDQPSQDMNEAATNITVLQPSVAIAERKDRGKSIISITDTIASDYGDEESGNEDEQVSNGKNERNIRSDRSNVVQSFRWSQGDWADYAAALSDQIDVGATPTDPDQQTNQGALVAGPTAEAIRTSRSTTQTVPLSGLGIGGTGLPVRSVETSEQITSPKPTTVASNDTPKGGNPLFAQLQSQSPPTAITTSQSLSALPTATSFEAVSSPTTPDGKSPSRRKGRPNPLTLHNISSSVSSPAMRSPSASRSLASPSMGGRTPPPTMPPSEPLPPLPEQSIVLQKKWSGGDHKRSHTHATGVTSTLHAILDDSEASASPSKRSAEEEEERSTKRSSDPSDNRSYFMRSHEPSTDVRPRTRVKSTNSPPETSIVSPLVSRIQPSESTNAVTNLTPSHLSATSIALVRANHESTMAGTDYAEAILDQVQRQPTYNELHKHSQETKSTDGKERESKVREQIPPNNKQIDDQVEDQEEEIQDGSDDEEDAQEAVVTSVTTALKATRASLARAPSLVRRDSDASSNLSQLRTTDSAAIASAALTQRRGSAADALEKTPPQQQKLSRSTDSSPGSSKLVSRMRAMIEARDNDGGSLTPKLVTTSASNESISSRDVEDNAQSKTIAERRRGTTNGPPSAWSNIGTSATSVQSSKPSINTAVQPTQTFIPARSPSAASLQGQTGLWTPNVLDTPGSMFGGMEGYENPNVPYDSQRTQSEAQSRRSDDSPIDRIKRTEGRFTGAFGEVALAFKQLQAEKRALEKIIRATTPLEGLGNNGESLAEYLTAMSAKLDISSNEIRKLLDLLDQQRSVMDYMVDTHKLELESMAAEMEDLKDDFDAVCEEADTHRDNAIQLTQDLDKAQHDVVLARAETLKFKTSFREEEGRKEKTVGLLKKAREELTKLKSEKRTNEESGDASVDSGLFDDSSDIRIQALEKELAEARASNVQLQHQLSERKTPSGNASPVTRSIISPAQMSDMDDIERERDALRERTLQQEKDISELRAQIALSGGHSNDSKLLNSLPAAREDQVRLLMQQMSEQRAREAQIRKAYRQLRDDLRKMQNLQQNDRKRTQATYSLLSTSNVPNSAGSNQQSIASAEMELLNDVEPDSTPTPRHLKRLSLPLVNKLAPVLSSPGTSMNNSVNSITNNNVTTPSTNGGITPIFSSNRRNSRRLSVDFSTGVLPVKETTQDDKNL